MTRERCGGSRRDPEGRRCPVVVLSATTGLPKGMRARVSALHARVAAGAAPGQHVEVAGAGHYVHRFRSDAVTRAVLDVVDRARRDG